MLLSAASDIDRSTRMTLDAGLYSCYYACSCEIGGCLLLSAPVHEAMHFFNATRGGRGCRALSTELCPYMRRLLILSSHDPNDKTLELPYA